MTDPLGNIARKRAYSTAMEYFKSQQTRQPPAGAPVFDLAKYLATTSERKITPKEKRKEEKPSVASWIFDKLVRGNYAAANMALSLAKGEGNPAVEFWEGLSGKDKTTYSDVLEAGGMEKGFLQSALGFGLDVFADPLTYVPVAGIISKGKQLVKTDKTKKALVKPIKERRLAEMEAKGQEPVDPSLWDLPTKGTRGELLKPSIDVDRMTKVAANAPPDVRGLERLLPDQRMVEDLPIPASVDELRAAPKAALDPEGLTRLERAALPIKIVPTSVKGKKGTQPALPTGILERFLGSARQGSVLAKAARKGVKNLKETMARTTLGASKLVDRVIAGDINAVKQIQPKPLPELHPFGDRVLKSKADNIFESRSAKFALTDKVSGADQVKIWKAANNDAKDIVSRAKMAKGRQSEAILDRTIKIYADVERQFINAGYKFETKLSDVVSDLVLRQVSITDDILKQFATKVKPGGEVWRSLQVIKAREAIQEAPTVKKIVDRIAQSTHDTKTARAGSFVQLKEFDKFLTNFGKQVGDLQGLSKTGQEATNKFIKAAIQSSKSSAQIGIEANARNIEDVISRGLSKNNPEIEAAVTRHLEKDLGTLPKYVFGENKATEWVMSRFATHWGQKELRPLTINKLASAVDTARMRGDFLAKMFKPYTTQERVNALKFAQGYKVADTQSARDLSGHIKATFDNMASKVTGQSVITRAVLPMEKVNRWMRKYDTGWEFTNKKVTGLDGIEVDYSKGMDWLDSWKSVATPKGKDDVQIMMFKMQEALEMASRERAVFDDMGARFGSRFKSNDFNVKVEGHPYLEGYYFPDEIAKQIPRLVKDWSVDAWKPTSEIIKRYDRLLSGWKSGVTIYRAGHHIRNMAGDMYLGMMDDVISVKPYMFALQVLKTQKFLYRDLKDIDDLVELGLYPRTMKTPKPNQILFRNKSGVPFTSEQLYAVASQKGLLEVTETIEDLVDMGRAVDRIGEKSWTRPLGGRGQQAARAVSEMQQHTARMAHFIDKVKKSRGNNLEEIFEQASRRSRKWHPTGLDLTETERKIFRRLAPFYSWTRKSIPLLMEGLVMNPGKTVIPAKAYSAMQELGGIEGVSILDPFPVDQMFPHWVKAQGVGPVSKEDGWLSKVSNQTPPGYVMAGIGFNPLTDLLAELDPTGPEGPLLSTGGFGLGMLTPAVKVPLELGTGHKTFTGEPIAGPEARPGALSQYAGEQIPLYSILQGITGLTPTGQETKKSFRGEDTVGGLSREALLQYFGAGVRGTGPYQGQARFEEMAPHYLQQRLGREQYIREFFRKQQEEEG